MTDNPFKIPKVSTLFELREEELRAKKQQREDAKTLKVFQKIPPSKRGVPRRRLLEDSKATVDGPGSAENASVILQKTKERYLLNDTHQQYISRLREMFFLEYSIAIQKAEIARLDEIAKREEKKLDLAEQCLEQDAALFDEFLKDSDKTSIEAVALAEKESRKRSDLGDEIKRLTAVQMKITSDITRLKEVVKDYKACENFLERLVPEPYRTERRKMREENLKAKWDAKRAARSTMTTGSSFTNLTDSPEPAARRPSFVIRRRSSLKPIGRGTQKLLASPPLKTMQEDTESSSDDALESEVFFSSPDQFLAIMYDLEEANLRLMRNYQETQEGIDWLRNLAAETKQRIETDNSVLANQHRLLQAEVESESEKSKELSFREDVVAFAGLDKTGQEELLQRLHEQISHVYQLCVQKADAPLSSVQLLTDIELKMINLMQEIQKLPQEEVKQALRAQEKMHRMEVKEERKREQRQHQEERIRKAIERAKAEPKKRTGRPVMTRSEPPRTESKDTKDAAALSEEEEELLFLFG